MKFIIWLDLEATDNDPLTANVLEIAVSGE